MKILTQEGWWEVTGDAQAFEKIKFANENQKSACKLKVELFKDLGVNPHHFQEKINPPPEDDYEEGNPIDQWVVDSVVLTARKIHYPNGIGGTDGSCQVHNDADPVPLKQDPNKMYCLRKTFPLTDNEHMDPDMPYFSIEMQAFVEAATNFEVNIDESDL